MKLKPIVAALALLAAGPALAAYPSAQAPAPKPMAPLPQAKLDRNQNPFYAQPADWYRRIVLSGLVQVYASATSRFAGLPAGAKNTATDLELARADIYLDARVNDITSVHIALSPYTRHFEGHDALSGNSRVGTYGIFQDENSFRPLGGLVDEATVTFADFSQSNMYARFGREYLRFGDYVRNVRPMTLTQALSQTQADAAEVGFVDMSGFNGSVFAFAGPQKVTNSAHQINNFGAQLGYDMGTPASGMHVNMSADFIYNMLAANYVQFVTGVGVPTSAGYNRVLPGVALTAQGTYGQFDGKVQVVTGLRDSSALDLAYKGAAANPGALYLGVGYTMPLMGYKTHLGVNYQGTREAVALLLPKHRVQGDLTVTVAKNTTVGATVVWDKDYKVSDGGSNNNVLSGLLNVSARFA